MPQLISNVVIFERDGTYWIVPSERVCHGGRRVSGGVFDADTLEVCSPTGIGLPIDLELAHLNSSPLEDMQKAESVVGRMNALYPNVALAAVPHVLPFS